VDGPDGYGMGRSRSGPAGTTPGDAGRPVVFLDRDGTLIREADYPSRPEQVELVPGAVEALRCLADAGFALVVVTNQSGIARGLFSEEDYRAVTARLQALLAREGVRLDAVYHCPHHPDFTGPCDCRKPGTGMFLRARDELGVRLEGAWVVGDRLRDLEPVRAFGGRGILVRTGYGRGEEAAGVPEGIVVVDGLREVPDCVGIG
jgi:D-glycero-D-manno-heptose 1,7-bisphosphate phosphatase